MDIKEKQKIYNKWIESGKQSPGNYEEAKIILEIQRQIQQGKSLTASVRRTNQAYELRRLLNL